MALPLLGGLLGGGALSGLSKMLTGQMMAQQASHMVENNALQMQSNELAQDRHVNNTITKDIVAESTNTMDRSKQVQQALNQSAAY